MAVSALMCCYTEEKMKYDPGCSVWLPKKDTNTSSSTNPSVGNTLCCCFYNTYTYNCITAKPDWSSNTPDTYLVGSLGYFLPDKPSSVPESNPNSEDESESEDTSVAKKGRKYFFCEEWVRKFDWLRFLRETNSNSSCKFCSQYLQDAGNTTFAGNACTTLLKNKTHWSNTVLV